jgi:hypothetical protein
MSMETQRASTQVRPNPFSIALVSVYLLAVGAWLIITKQIPSPGFLRIVRALMRKPYAGQLGAASPESGHCYTAPLAAVLLSDRDSASALRLYEDGREIGPGGAAHADIRARGGGRFSHWGEQLYFSTSDNSDPRTNGRCYTVREVR